MNQIIIDPKTTLSLNESDRFTELKEIFDSIKELASKRNDQFKKFTGLYREIYSEDLPAVIDRDTDWQDVLVWGIEDGDFEEFLNDIAITRKTGECAN